MPPLQISYKDPAQLTRRDRNPRTHSPAQIRKIAASIKEFGFVTPVLIDGSDGIIAGHGRVDAAKLLGMTAIPTVCVGHLTPPQVRAYVIADNRLAELAGWDQKVLAIELQELAIEPDFEVAVTGFEIAGGGIVIGQSRKEAANKADAHPRIDWTRPAVSQPGDLWRIGDHYLLCGDPLDSESYQRLLEGAKAELVFTDPPNAAALESTVSGRDIAMASCGVSESEYGQFLKTAFDRLVAASADGAIHFICSDWRHMRAVLEAADQTYTELEDLCIWTKTNAGTGSFYRSQHELVFVFKNGGAPHVNTIKPGRRNRSNVWRYPGLTRPTEEKKAALSTHRAMKPLALIADAILDCSKPGAIVLDPFAKSGSTLLAAERTGRRGYGIEREPHYIDTVIKRFDSHYGVKAVHANSSTSFEAVKAARFAKKDHGSQDRTERRGGLKGDSSCSRRRHHAENRLPQPAKTHAVPKGPRPKGSKNLATLTWNRPAPRLWSRSAASRTRPVIRR